MTVRPAREADAAAVTRIHERAWSVSLSAAADPAWVVDRPFAEREAEWRRACRGEGASLWVAEDEAGQVVGFVGAGPSSGATAMMRSGSSAGTATSAWWFQPSTSVR